MIGREAETGCRMSWEMLNYSQLKARKRYSELLPKHERVRGENYGQS